MRTACKEKLGQALDCEAACTHSGTIAWVASVRTADDVSRLRHVGFRQTIEGVVVLMSIPSQHEAAVEDNISVTMRARSYRRCSLDRY